MNNLNNITNKILGNNPNNKPLINKSCSNFNSPGQHLNRTDSPHMNLGGMGMRQNKPLGNFGNRMGNQSNVLMKIKKLMDQLPEVKKASGDLKIHLENGDIIDVKLNYKDGGI